MLAVERYSVLNFLNEELKKANNPIELVKAITNGLDPYLEYYALLRYENLQELLQEAESHTFITIRGASGSGKSSFKTIIKRIFNEKVNIFEYNCSETTELDDIFLKFYKFTLENPIKTDLLRGAKSGFKPHSIDEQILHYLKNLTGNLVLIFDNFAKLLDDNAELKAENIKSFLEFLSTLPNVKTIVISSVNTRGCLDTTENNILETRLNSLEDNQIKEFLQIFKINVPQSLLPEIYDKTNGYVFSLKFLILASKVLQLPISEIIKEVTNKNAELDTFIARKLISKLSVDAKKILYYLAFFRHEISQNILKNIEHFSNVQEELEILQNYMLVEGNKNYDIRDFLREMLYNNLPQREKAKLHEKIADFYAEQIPLKPNERVIEISRSSMYSEKFYHYNTFSRISKNSELNSARAEENKYQQDVALTPDRIKYIASTKYFPDFEIKHKADTESNTDQKAIDIDIDTSNIKLSEEEKALLNDYSNNDKEEENDYSSYEDNYQEEETDTNQQDFEEVYDDDFEEIKNDVFDENQKAENLLRKGLNLFNDGDSAEAITYLKNAATFFQNNNPTNYYTAKFTLAKALSENFKLEEAAKYLNELIAEGIPNELLADVLFELGLIAEYNKNNKDALDCYTTAINIANDNNLPLISSKIYFQMALMFDEANDIDNALQYYLLTAEEAINANDKTILASSYANIASIYEEKNEINDAILYYKQSLLEDEKNNNYEGQAKTLSSLGNIYANKNEINVAINLFIKETKMARQTDDSYLIASSYLELGDTFIKKQDYKNALKAYLLAKKNIDSTISTDSKNKIERRFDMIVDEIGENAYRFLLRELKK